MISGRVNHQREPVIRVSVRDQAGELVGFDAVVDTGFDGSLTLPATAIASLGLQWRGKAEAVLANGVIDECDVYAGKVEWDGATRNVLVEAAETDPLVGMAMMEGFELKVQIKAGGNLTLTAIPG